MASAPNWSEIFAHQHEEVPDEQNVSFLGTLMSNKMSKDNLIIFIQRKCQACLLHLDDLDEQKSYFFWMIMELFCKNNGKVLMAEIATLLFRCYGNVRRKIGYVKDQEDWCLPLAKLLCTAATGNEHRKAIVQMGYQFGYKGWLYAAHICYVVAQMALGTCKQFHLIGLNWYINYQYIPKEVMERTEVYEYILSLTSGIGQPCFQEFKYYYAWNLARDGLSDLALDYCKSIARNIFTFPRLVSSYFMERVILLSSKLLEGKKEEEVEWVLKLCRFHKAFSVHNPEFSIDLEPSSNSYDSEELLEELDSRYIVGELLGKGFFGAVYAGVRKADGKQVAMKYISKDHKGPLPGDKPLEVELMEVVSKPPRCENVVELLEWFDMSTSFILVMEQPIPCMNLHEYCQSHKNHKLPEYVIREVMRQVVQAVWHCFNRRVLHEDLRANNILINPVTLEVKLIDFGCGRWLLDYPRDSTVLSSYIWNLAVLLVDMICERTCFQNIDIVIDKCSKFVSRECCHLLSWCLKIPEKRPTFDEILNHNWFKLELQDLVQDPNMDQETSS